MPTTLAVKTLTAKGAHTQFKTFVVFVPIVSFRCLLKEAAAREGDTHTSQTRRQHMSKELCKHKHELGLERSRPINLLSNCCPPYPMASVGRAAHVRRGIPPSTVSVPSALTTKRTQEGRRKCQVRSTLSFNIFHNILSKEINIIDVGAYG